MLTATRGGAAAAGAGEAAVAASGGAMRCSRASAAGPAPRRRRQLAGCRRRHAAGAADAVALVRRCTLGNMMTRAPCPANRLRGTAAKGSEAVFHASGDLARRDDVGAAERGHEVVEALLVESVQQVELQLERHPVLLETRAQGEVPDHARLDAGR